jgi:chorismate mutase
MEETAEKFTRLLEVYIDDFIQLAQTTNPEKLLHLARTVLHGIHSVFPSPVVTGHAGEDAVSIKNLKQGDGLWATRKELLG